MKPARMGRGDGLWQGKQSRGDSILWITQGLRAAGELPEVNSLTPWKLLAGNSEACLHRLVRMTAWRCV